MPPTKKSMAANRACLAKELGVSVERFNRARYTCSSRAATRRRKKSGKKSTKRRKSTPKRKGWTRATKRKLMGRKRTQNRPLGYVRKYIKAPAAPW
ncbi:MAG: hypothetical protein CMB64_03500 [Euryarchaeota archaeon]|nr:hypothetical protein [Euryarchaeota archaeon]